MVQQLSVNTYVIGGFSDVFWSSQHPN